MVIQQGCGGQNNRRFVLGLLAVTSPERVAAEGTLPVGGTPAQFGEQVRTELEKWRWILRQAAIVPDSR